jgi:hypothetical protein
MRSDFHAFRRHSRLFAFRAVLVICLQLAVSALGGFYAVAWQADGRGAFTICTPTGIVRVAAAEGENPATFHAGGQHCPLCSTASNALPLSATGLSFFFPEPDLTDFLPAASAGFQPVAPDQRHAPSHAPPFSFA